MTDARITSQELETWAAYLLNHSLGGITSDDRVMIKGERICWPLMEVLERGVIEAGGVPDVLLVPPNNDRGRVWSATMGRSGSPDQLQAAPEWHRQRYEAMTKYVEVLGAEDPSQYTGLSSAQVQSLAEADQPFGKIRLSKPWVITLFPTAGMAEGEGMNLEDYTRFIVRASTADPLPLKAAEKKLKPLFDEGATVTVVTEHPVEHRELMMTVDISQSLGVMSYGLRNFPDGEVFTSPDANSTSGEIFVDLPVNYGGNDIQGIYLRFENGKIVEYSAQTGHEHLAAIIETDAGSHRLGEVALGMNPGLDKVLKHPLFVEKVGGTLHIAIGASYENCYVPEPGSDDGADQLAQLEKDGVLNRSAQHVDIVTDFRPGGSGRKVLIDDNELRIRNGYWTAS